MLNAKEDVTRRVMVPRLRPVTIDHSEEIRALMNPAESELEAFRRRRHDNDETNRIRKL